MARRTQPSQHQAWLSPEILQDDALHLITFPPPGRTPEFGVCQTVKEVMKELYHLLEEHIHMIILESTNFYV